MNIKEDFLGVQSSPANSPECIDRRFILLHEKGLDLFVLFKYVRALICCSPSFFLFKCWINHEDLGATVSANSSIVPFIIFYEQ